MLITDQKVVGSNPNTATTVPDPKPSNVYKNHNKLNVSICLIASV